MTCGQIPNIVNSALNDESKLQFVQEATTLNQQSTVYNTASQTTHNAKATS